jgi:hypothetical protein
LPWRKQAGCNRDKRSYEALTSDTVEEYYGIAIGICRCSYCDFVTNRQGGNCMEKREASELF